MKTPRIQRALDDARRPIVRVELVRHPGISAIVDAEDYDRLIATGISKRWYLNRSARGGHCYVRVDLPSVAGKLGLVGRLLIGAGRNQIVRYRNGDRLDLRRCNLMIERGRARGQTLTPDEAPPRPAPNGLASSTPGNTSRFDPLTTPSA